MLAAPPFTHPTHVGLASRARPAPVLTRATVTAVATGCDTTQPGRGKDAHERTETIHMLLIHCPWCGPRAESEFTYGGESNIVRPIEAASKDKGSWLTDEQWGDYVFMRKNTRGRFVEQWNHAQGCRKWFDAVRNTANHRFIATYPMGKAPDETRNAPQESTVTAGEQTKP